MWRCDIFSQWESRQGSDEGSVWGGQCHVIPNPKNKIHGDVSEDYRLQTTVYFCFSCSSVDMGVSLNLVSLLLV